MKNILIVTPYCLLDDRAGGPVRSISNLTARYKDKYIISIMAPGKSLGGKYLFPVKRDKWNTVERVKVYYTINIVCFFKELKKCTKAIDVIYLNSIFSIKYSIMINVFCYLGILRVNRVVVAPRGELAKSALSKSPWRKKIYLYISKLFGLHQAVIWHATADKECMEIKSIYPNAKVFIAKNLTLNDSPSVEGCSKKKKNELKVVVVSRIVPIKNLLFSLHVLSKVSSKYLIFFDIYGPIEDVSYWDSCEEAIQKMPKHITVTYKKSLKHQEVLNIIQGYDLFFMPTQGENFGHAIAEGLKGGCPVLISDMTPWRGLDKFGAGWDIPLSNTTSFVAKVEKVAGLSEAEMESMRVKVKDYMAKFLENNGVDEQYAKLFGFLD